MMKVFRDYCGVINEESIRKNFVLIYEIIDEVIDYGHPQLVATEHVRNYTVSDPVMIEAKKNEKGGLKKASKWNIFSKTAPSNSVTRPMTNLNSLGSTSKKKGKSDKNEILVDIFEKLSVLFN